MTALAIPRQFHGRADLHERRHRMVLARARRTAAAWLAGMALLAVACCAFLTAGAAPALAAADAPTAGTESCATIAPPRATPTPTVKKTTPSPSPSASHTASPTPTASSASPTPSSTPTPTLTPTTPTPTPTTPTPTPTTPTPTPTTASPTAPSSPASSPASAPASSAPPASSSPPASPTGGAAPASRIILTAVTTASLCVSVLPLQQSSERGTAAAWAVSAWATGAAVPDAKITLQASPAGSGTPAFTTGCGHGAGTSTCDLGALNPTVAAKQAEARLTVPLAAVTVSAATLTAAGSAAGLQAIPAASGTITILTPPVPVGATTTLPVLSPAGVGAPAPTLSPGGNAGGLFPTVAPSPTFAAGTVPTQQVASTTELSGGASSLGPEVFGGIALALALVFAATRLTVRRPAPATPEVATAPPAEAPAPAAEAGKHQDSGKPAGEPSVPPVDLEAT
jgi:hypothetical protein